MSWLTASSVQGESSAWSEDFDGPDLAWTVIDEPHDARMIAHQRELDDSRPGVGVERVSLACPGGSSVHVAASIGRAPVIDELRLKIWLRSNRPGALLAARVVLPRTQQPQSNLPYTVLVRGPRYEAVGSWQELVLEDFPQLVKRQARVLRTEAETTIDEKQAYVDQVVLLVPGGAGGTTIWTDDLTLDGVLLSATNGPQGKYDRLVTPAAWNDRPTNPATTNNSQTPTPIEMVGTTLMVDKRPLLPRIATARGDSFEQLARLGFNTILLDRLPSHEQQIDAARLGLWLICRPPSFDDASADPAPPDVAATARVLAWHFDLTGPNVDLHQTSRQIAALRQWDRLRDRPVVISTDSDFTSHRRQADLLIAEVSTSQSLERAARAMHDLRRHSTRGTPLWLQLATDVSPTIRDQARAFADTQPSGSPATIDEVSLRPLLRLACAYGFRGVVVAADESFSHPDPVHQRLTTALQLANLELELIEPWMATGKLAAQAATSDPELQVWVMQVEQSRLLVPIRLRRDDQPAARDDAPPVTVVVPGAAESDVAHLLTPAGMERMRTERVAGGLRLTLRHDDAALVLLTSDPQVEANLKRRVRQSAPHAVPLLRTLSVARLKAAQAAKDQLARLGHTSPPADRAIERASRHIGLCDAQLAVRHSVAAYIEAASAVRALDDASQALLAEAMPRDQLASYPMLPSIDTLSDFAAMRMAIDSLGRGDNLLHGGDFEDLRHVRTQGWRHLTEKYPGIGTHVELSPNDPRHGRFALTLSAMPTETGTFLPNDRPMIEVVSPPVTVPSGEPLEIIGWLRIDDRLDRGGELVISDSLGGDQLALRASRTKGWQTFRLIRHTIDANSVSVRFSLSGLGSVAIDGVMIRPLLTPTPARLPELKPPTQAKRPLFDLPRLR